MHPIFLFFSLLCAISVEARSAVVEIRRVDAAPPAVVAWYTELDQLLTAVAQAQRVVARVSVVSPDKIFLRIAEYAEVAARHYDTLTGDSSGANVVREGAIAARAANAATARESFFGWGRTSLYRGLLLMRQEALSQKGPPGRYPINTLLTVREGDHVSELAYLDIAGDALVDKGRIVSPTLQSVVEAARQTVSDERAFSIMGRQRVWHTRRGAEMYLDLSAQDYDGRLRIRYAEADGTVAGQSRFYLITRSLLECGYSVNVRNGELIAVLSRGKRLTPYEVSERFSIAWRIFDEGHRLLPYLKDFLAGSVSNTENAQRLDELAKILAAEGALEFFKEGDSLAAALSVYRAQNTARETLRGEMNRALARLRLGEFPLDAAVGQRTIDLYYNALIDAAVARGEVRLKNGTPVLAADYSPYGKDSRADMRVRVVGRGNGFILWEGASRDVGGAHRTSHIRKPRPVKERPMMFNAEVLYRGTRNEPLEAVITYSRAKAGEGGKIFVTPFLAQEDFPAAKKSLAVLSTSAEPGEALAGWIYDVPFFFFPQGDWSPHLGLRLDFPEFGPAQIFNGRKVQRVKTYRKLILSEGDRVRLDPRTGILEVLE